MFRPFVGALAALLLAGGVASAQTAVPFQTLAQGTRGNNGPARNLVIRSELDLRRTGVARLVPAGTRVDFNHEMIVAVFMGDQPSGGYGLAITSVERRMLPRPTINPPPPAQYALTVAVQERRPAPGSIQPSIMTSPYHVVKLARSKDRVDFRAYPLFRPPVVGVRPTTDQARTVAPAALSRQGSGTLLCFVPRGARLTVLQTDAEHGRALVQFGDRIGWVKLSRLEAQVADPVDSAQADTGQADTGRANTGQADTGQANTGQADPTPSIGLAGSVANQ